MLLNGNWVDLVILAVLLFFISEAWRVGFWVILADFLSFLLSLLIALRGYQFASNFLRANFSLSHSISNALGFLITAILAESILGILFAHSLRRLPDKFWKNNMIRFLAVIPALGEGFILISFLLTLAIGLPISPRIKTNIADSRIGSLIIQKTTGIEVRLNEIFGGVIEDSLTYLTIKPQSHESVPLKIEEKSLTIDEKSESDMLNLVNEERKKAGVGQLEWASSIVPVSRVHARDMWEREYFSHISPEGKDVGDRLNERQVKYRFAGENLALAPTLATAHTGLMNSEGHRKNILEPSFKKIGIGVIDNGYYGKMFVQVFTN